jgi:hypothetical protein
LSSIDRGGRTVWIKRVPRAISGSIAVDPSGNVIATGLFFRKTDFDPGPGVFELKPPKAGSGRRSLYFLKLNTDGEFVWAKQIKRDITSNGIATDRSGNVYVTGLFRGAVDFDPRRHGVHVLNSIPSMPDCSICATYDVFVLKLNSDGSFAWVDAMGGTAGESGADIALDGGGNIYLTGTYNGKPDFDPGPGVFALGTGSPAVFVEKLDSGGNFLWMRKINGTGEDQSSSLAVDTLGSVYATGTFEGTVDFDPGPGTFNLTSPAANIFISKLGPLGGFKWAVTGPPNEHFAGNIALSANGSVHSSGFFEGIGDFDFDPGPGIFNTKGPSAFIWKLAQP